MLGKSGLRQRAALLEKYPQLTSLAAESQRIRDQLRQVPVLPTEQDQIERQRDLAGALGKVSSAQERLLREIALRRDPSRLVFPPQASGQAIRQAVPRNEAVLVFVTTGRHWHAFLLRRSGMVDWSIKAPRQVRREMVNLLRALGNSDRRAALSTRQLSDQSWRETAGQLWDLLVGDLPADTWEGLEELVIVPDGVLWYLPFEILHPPEGEQRVSLFSRTRIRYAPLAALSIGDRRGRAASLSTVFVAGRLQAGEDPQQNKELFEYWQEVLPNLQALTAAPRGASALLAGNWDRLVVWDDLDEIKGGSSPYSWSPAQVDRGQPRSSLGEWMQMPWGAPDQIVLPGFHTAAERGLRGSATGHEVFLSICGLMSTGTRTILLSRWPVGGSTTRLLTREFVQELPHLTAAEAWRRSVELVRASEVDPFEQPRLKAGAADEVITADHPFFWAGYLLVDTGAVPDEPVPPRNDEGSDLSDERGVDAPAGDD
jgi:hypothetical protein